MEQQQKPAKQDLDDYENQYLARQGQRPSPKPAETRQTSSSCKQLWEYAKTNSKVLWQVWGETIAICYNFVIENRRDQIYQKLYGFIV